MFDKTIIRRGAFQTVASLAAAATGSSSLVQGVLDLAAAPHKDRHACGSRNENLNHS